MSCRRLCERLRACQPRHIRGFYLSGKLLKALRRLLIFIVKPPRSGKKALPGIRLRQFLPGQFHCIHKFLKLRLLLLCQALHIHILKRVQKPLQLFILFGSLLLYLMTEFRLIPHRRRNKTHPDHCRGRHDQRQNMPFIRQKRYFDPPAHLLIMSKSILPLQSGKGILLIQIFISRKHPLFQPERVQP